MIRTRANFAARFRCVLLGGVALLLTGCHPRGLVGAPYTLEAPPTYAELAAKHNARVALLKTLAAQGVIELRWSDDDGKHFEQGDLDVWLRMPNETALQVSKLGERLFWLGCNHDASWMFDLRTKGATIAEINEPTAVAPAGETTLSVSMISLLEMMGLAAIPAEQPENSADVSYDKKMNAWVLSTNGSAGPLRLYFDGRRLLPVRVDLLDAHPQENANDLIVLSSTLRLERYEYITIIGQAPDKYPLVPTLIDITRADGKGSLKISVSKPVAKDESFRDEYFQLPWLLKALKPDEVRDHRPLPGATP